jgi:hypothetical protein
MFNDHPRYRCRAQTFRNAEKMPGDAWRCCGADTPLRSLSNVSRSRPTTDQPRCFVAAWPMLILQKASARRRPRRTSPIPLRAPGPAATSTDSPVPLLRAGPDVETRPKSLSGGIRAKGTKVACGMSSPRRTARRRYYARPIRHSVGRKMALNRNYCRSVTIQTLGLDASPRNAWPPAPLPTPGSRFGIFVEEALNLENVRCRWMPAVQHP